MIAKPTIFNKFVFILKKKLMYGYNITGANLQKKLEITHHYGVKKH